MQWEASVLGWQAAWSWICHVICTQSQISTKAIQSKQLFSVRYGPWMRWGGVKGRDNFARITLEPDFLQTQTHPKPSRD